MCRIESVIVSFTDLSLAHLPPRRPAPLGKSSAEYSHVPLLITFTSVSILLRRRKTPLLRTLTSSWWSLLRGKGRPLGEYLVLVINSSDVDILYSTASTVFSAQKVLPLPRRQTIAKALQKGKMGSKVTPPE